MSIKSQELGYLIRIARNFDADVDIRKLLKEVNELERIATEYEADKHYIELGKAVEKAYNKGAFIIYDVVEDYNQNIISYNSDSDLEDLLEWAEGRTND